MRLWRSISLLVLVLGILAGPAHSADKKKAKTPKPVAAQVAKARTASAPDSVKVTNAKAKKSRPSAGHIPQRRAWMMGLGMGWGSTIFRGAGTFDFAAHPRVALDPGGTLFRIYPQPVFGTNDKDNGLTNVISVAYAIQPTFAIGVERLNWSNGQNAFGKWVIGLSAITATWYPQATGWYVRLGAGPANATATPGFVNTVAVTGENIGLVDDKTRYTDDGFGGLAGLGFEYRLLGRVSAAPEIHALATTLDKSVSGCIFGGNVSLNWWF